LFIIFLIFLNHETTSNDLRILRIDKCNGNEKYMHIQQCELSGTLINFKAKFISTIDSIIVSIYSLIFNNYFNSDF